MNFHIDLLENIFTILNDDRMISGEVQSYHKKFVSFPGSAELIGAFRYLKPKASIQASICSVMIRVKRNFSWSHVQFVWLIRNTKKNTHQFTQYIPMSTGRYRPHSTSWAEESLASFLIRGHIYYPSISYIFFFCFFCSVCVCVCAIVFNQWLKTVPTRAASIWRFTARACASPVKVPEVSRCGMFI